MNLTELIKTLTWHNLITKLKEILNLIPKTGEEIVTKIDEELGNEDWKSSGGGSSYTFEGGLTEDEGVVSWYQEVFPGFNQVSVEDNTALTIGTPNDFGFSITNSILGSTADIRADKVIIASPVMNLQNIPTSSAGLSSGDIWNNEGVLNIVT